MMEVYTHTDIIVERLRRKPLFGNEAVSEQLSEDEPRLISL